MPRKKHVAVEDAVSIVLLIKSLRGELTPYD
jgi:hypothetical protein